MARQEDDWRLVGQERYLKGATLTWRRYRAPSDTWEHDHCQFCWAKFMDPDFSDAHRRQVEEHPEVLTEGYATPTAHDGPAGYLWVCKSCFDDFAERFEWRVAGSDRP
jgi:hypothetical protein